LSEIARLVSRAIGQKTWGWAGESLFLRSSAPSSGGWYKGEMHMARLAERKDRGGGGALPTAAGRGLREEFKPRNSDDVAFASPESADEGFDTTGAEAFLSSTVSTALGLVAAGEKNSTKENLQSPRFRDNVELERIFDGEKTLSTSDNGIPVKKVQRGLYDLGLKMPVYGIDGKWGPETKRAVIDFQILSGLTGKDIDGIVGPVTLGLLDSSLIEVNDVFTESNDKELRDKIKDILLPWNSALLEQMGDEQYKIKIVDKIEITHLEYRGASEEGYSPSGWETKKDSFYSLIDEGKKEILIQENTPENCAVFLYHEMMHANVPKKISEAGRKEQEIYTREQTQTWAYERGLTNEPPESRERIAEEVESKTLYQDKIRYVTSILTVSGWSSIVLFNMSTFQDEQNFLDFVRTGDVMNIKRNEYIVLDDIEPEFWCP
jgi:hypothetical protein